MEENTMEQKMIENLEKTYGKSFSEWIQIVKESGLVKHNEMISFLKKEHNFTHGYANLVVHKARRSDAGSANDGSDLIGLQYKGKENLRSICDQLIKTIQLFGEDIEFAPKKAYISVRRKKQFVLIQPSTKTRLDVGINIKGKEPVGRLEKSGSFNSMCSHRVRITNVAELDDELSTWIKEAYDAAG